jgi:hypothetical protein
MYICSSERFFTALCGMEPSMRGWQHISRSYACEFVANGV